MIIQRFVHRSVVPLLLVAALLSLAAVAVAEEHDEITLGPSYGDGKLTIIGNAFKPNERVTITAKVDGTSYTFTTSADSGGSFRLETGVPVPPGSGVELHAVGDQGTGRAAITSGPGLLPPQSTTPTELPRTGAPATDEPANALPLAVALALAGGLSLWLLRRGRVRA
jgi:hypothetical protein